VELGEQSMWNRYLQRFRRAVHPNNSVDEEYYGQWCNIEPTIVEDSFLFSIGQFLNRNERQNSSLFEIKVGDLVSGWKLVVFPNGYEVNSEFVSLYLFKMSSEVIGQTMITVSILDRSKTKTQTQSVRYSFIKDKSTYKGFPKFLSIAELKKNKAKLLPGGTLTIVCDLIITGRDVVTSGTDVVTSETKIIDSNLEFAGHEIEKKRIKDAEQMLQNKENTDFQIICKDKTILCHKVILASRSDVFKAMFDHDNMKEASSDVLEIKDFACEVVEELLHYIYTGEVQCKDPVELYKVADKYLLEELKKWLEAKLCLNVGFANVLESLQLADQCNANKLKMVALTFLATHWKTLKEDEECQEFLQNHPLLKEAMHVMENINSK